jgi:hypothetical protein
MVNKIKLRLVFSQYFRFSCQFSIKKLLSIRTLLGLYFSGRQSQQGFLLLSPSTHSLHVSARAGHLQVNIFFEASYCLLTDPLFGLSLHEINHNTEMSTRYHIYT